MKIFTSSKSALILSVFTSFSITSIYPNTSESLLMQAFKEQCQDELESVLKGILMQLNSVDLVLEDLALIISNDQINSITNKKDIIKSIRSLRATIDTIKNDAFVHVNLASLYILLQVNKALIDHIIRAIDNDFTDLPAFKLEQCILRNTKGDITVEDVFEAINKNTRDLTLLEKKAKKAGLHWYNKLFRTVDNWIVQPGQKYKIHQRTGKLLFATALITLSWWRLCDRGEPENNGLSLEKWLREKLGERPKIGLDDYNKSRVTNQEKLKLLGNLELLIREYTTGSMPMVSFLASLTPTVLGTDIRNFLMWGKKKVNTTANFLRGGAFKKTEEDDETKFDPKVTFDDLVGLEHAKETLSLVVKYIEDPERFDRAKLTPEKGYLLTGPTRTGKSYTAEALAGEIKKVIRRQSRNPNEFGFYVIKASYIIKHGISNLLDMAKNEAPCVLFIDEIDLLGLQRAGGNREILSEFLLSMSGCLESNPKKQVIILAATNKPENLDEALKQRGRFGKEIRFEYPSFEDRKNLLLKKLDALSINIAAINIDKLAQETEGCSFEDLNAMIKHAFQKSKIRGEALNQHCLEESLDTEVRNVITKSSKNLPEHEKQLLAIHQAGHALANVLLESKEKLAKVTILPVMSKLKEEVVWDAYYKDEEEKQKTIEYGQMFTYHGYDTLGANSREEKLKRCQITLAGHVAEKVLLGSSGYSYHMEDRQRALQITKSIVMQGILVDKLPKDIQNRMFEDAFTLLDKCELEITRLLEQNKELLQKLADTLQEKETLTAREVHKLFFSKEVEKIQEQDRDPALEAQFIAKELGFKEITSEKTV